MSVGLLRISPITWRILSCLPRHCGIDKRCNITGQRQTARKLRHWHKQIWPFCPVNLSLHPSFKLKLGILVKSHFQARMPYIVTYIFWQCFEIQIDRFTDILLTADMINIHPFCAPSGEKLDWKQGDMDCDGSTTDDDSTEDEEDTKTADDNTNSLSPKTRW